MTEESDIEAGVRRIGSEQELFLVDQSWRPAPGARAVLERIDDPRFRSGRRLFELALDADPQLLAGDGLARMQTQLSQLLERLRTVCDELGLQPVLTGVLPTLRKTDLGRANGEPTEPACTAGFRVHLQVGTGDVARMHGIAQLLAGPLLAVATNSPLLFGKRLWADTRIALLRRAVDGCFGSRLVELEALRLHHAADRRLNRACCDVVDGVRHLRIETGVLPAGPSVLDEVANAAYWLGLMVEIGAKHEDITREIELDHAQANFYAAAHAGIAAQLTWFGGEEVGVAQLTLDRLLPMAEAGLKRQGIDEGDIERYLGVVEQRVRTTRTGTRWMLSSLAAMREKKGTNAERLDALVAATIARQATGRPVAEWERARLGEAGGSRSSYLRVDHYMTTDIFTVQADDAIDRVADLMGWERIRHVPVEDGEHRLVGLVSYRSVLRHLMANRLVKSGATAAVSDIMRTNVMTVTPQTPTLEAIGLMRRYRIGCLPVLQDERLVGIVTEEDFMNIAAELLEQKLVDEGDS